ncbi:MAG TPA: AMP-dependent synthetase/ligase [Nocardioidaceae bacterium]|nr:AMP-dependent synthetase/ligase [Nocardioidaceae bacterium]
MRAFANPATYQVPATGSLTDDVLNQAETRPTAAAFSRKIDGSWQDVTYPQFRDEVIAVAKGLVAAGVQPGDRVALLSRTRYEWTVVDYAIWWIGAATVPVYETSSPEQIAWILSDSEAVAAIVETDDHRDRVEQVRDRAPGLKQTWVIDDGGIKTLTELGAEVTDDEVEARRSAVKPTDMATLIYTSGTTGRPKGCILTHGNFMFELSVATREMDKLFLDDDSSTLLFLPLAHIFARIIQVGCIKAGARLGHSSNIKELTSNLAEFRPTFILAVPRVFEKVFNTASQRAHAEGKGRIFDAAAESAIRYSQALDGSGPNLLRRARHAVFDRLVYSRLRAALGGNTTYAISGGAPLGDRLAHFFRGIGVPVLEGYGLTETTAALTVNLPDAQRIGTVGRPLPGTEVKLGDSGELLFRGGQIFPGYWGNETATAAALDSDGWFHTGDIGEIDDEGFVRITGRMKEILVTAGGKNVAPAALEDPIRAHPLVSQCMVVGDGKPFIGALITLDAEALEVWAEQRDLPSTDNLDRNPDVQAAIQKAVDDANATVSQAESIRKFRILPVDWTEESGHLTPSLKLRRSVVMRDFADEVEALYS